MKDTSPRVFVHPVYQWHLLDGIRVALSKAGRTPLSPMAEGRMQYRECSKSKWTIVTVRAWKANLQGRTSTANIQWSPNRVGGV